MTEVDVHDDWSPPDDLVALHGAEDADELRRRLILFPAAPGNSADAFEPWCLLHGVHKDEPDGAVATALLLLTDRRWRNATGRLILAPTKNPPATRLTTMPTTAPSLLARYSHVARDFVLRVAESWPHRKVRETAIALRHPPETAPAPVVEVIGARGTAAPSTVQPSLF